MAEDTLPKAPGEGGPLLLDTPVYEMLARKADRGGSGLTFAGNVRITDTRNGRVVYIPFPDASKAQRMKVKTAADSNGVAVCNTWDGTNAGTTDFNVRVVCSTAAGEQLWVFGVTPNAGVQKDSKDVTLMEYVSGPTEKVRLRQVGGTLGVDGETQSSWTYDLYDPSNTFQRASALSPAVRELPTWTDAASWGEAIFLNGTWQLIRAYEPIHDKEDCDDADFDEDA